VKENGEDIKARGARHSIARTNYFLKYFCLKIN
jgi:hypothetical protein